MGTNIKDNKTFKAELHIHTPASKCYKGAKDDDEYLRIIEEAYSKNIKIIAITDHNSIKGYEKILQLKEKLLIDVNTLKEISDSQEAKNKIKRLQKLMVCFDSMLILPGVEFEVNNGIHLLVIFNPNTDTSEIVSFLKKGGYNDDTFGQENDVFSNWSIFDLYDESKKYDCLIIDAHTDSDKGIYNTIKEGTTRVHAFTNPNLSGICYKSEKQRKNILNLLATPKYKRTNPLVFLKSSDSHELNEIGKDISYFCLANLTWDDFKESFSNPTDCIFTVFPKVQSIIKNVTKYGNCLYIDKCDEDRIERFCKYLCSLANSEGGFILFGGESSEVINGIAIHNENEVNEYFNNFIEKGEDKISGYVKLSSNIYPIKNGHYILIAKIAKSNELVDVNNSGIIYHYKKGEAKILSATEIENILSNRYIERFSDQIENELITIRKSSSAIGSFIKSMPIINSYKEKSIPIGNAIINAKLLEPIKMNNEQKHLIESKFSNNGNGKSKGNIYYFDNIPKPRLQDAFLRISLPKYNIMNLPKTVESQCIYLTPGGAAFYSERIVNLYNTLNLPVWLVTPKSDYSIKFLCAFLKSSFFIWYGLNKFDTFDFFSPKRFYSIFVPRIHNHNSQDASIVRQIEENVDHILNVEKEFLKIDLHKTESPNDIITQHNDKTKSFFSRIDDLIFELLHLQDDEINTIKEYLRSKYIYVP